MRSVSKITIFILLVTLWLTIPPKVKAAWNCNKEPDWKNAIVSYLFNDTSQDCSLEPYQSSSTPLSQEYYDNAIVACVTGPQLNPTYSQEEVAKAKEIYDKVQFDDGTVSTALDDLPNFALDAQNLTENLADPVLGLDQSERMIANYYDENNPNSFEATCEALGYPGTQKGRLECAQANNATLDNVAPQGSGGIESEKHINLLAIANQDKLLTSLEKQYLDKVEDKKFLNSCVNGTAPDDVNCYNNYNINPSIKATDVSLPSTFEEYQQLPSVEKQRIDAATQANKAGIPAYFCISRHLNLGANTLTSYIGAFYDALINDTRCKEIPIPGLVGSVEKATQRYLRYGSLDNQNKQLKSIYEEAEGLANASDPIIIPPVEEPKYETVRQKIMEVGKECLPVNNKTSFTGGTTPVEGGLPTFEFSLANLSVSNLLNLEPVIVYSAWLVQPQEAYIFQQITGTHPSAYIRNFFSSFFSSSLSSAVNAPYTPDKDGAAEASAEIGYYEEEVIDPDTGEVTIIEKPITATLSTGGDDMANWITGNPTRQHNNIGLQGLMPLDSDQRWESECYYEEAVNHNPLLPAKLNHPSDLLGDYTDPGSCKEPIRATGAGFNSVTF